MQYPFCNQTVTCYRLIDGQVQRQVLKNCYYHYRDEKIETDTGSRWVRKFLLIQPGEKQMVFPGDRILAGEGPEVTAEQWATFLPVNVPALGQVAYATPWYWAGRISHTEAGRK